MATNDICKLHSILFNFIQQNAVCKHLCVSVCIELNVQYLCTNMTIIQIKHVLNKMCIDGGSYPLLRKPGSSHSISSHHLLSVPKIKSTREILRICLCIYILYNSNTNTLLCDRRGTSRRGMAYKKPQTI